jgi:uncharacterized protein YuzE
MRTIIYIICIFSLCFCAYSCKSRPPVYVPVETSNTKKDNKDRNIKDSIRIVEKTVVKDSINIRDSIVYKVNEHGEIISKEIYRWKERYRENNYLLNHLQARYDSLLHVKQDSVRVEVPYPVVEYIEVNKLTGLQNFLVWCGRILILSIIGYFGYRYIKRKIPISH